MRVDCLKSCFYNSTSVFQDILIIFFSSRHFLNETKSIKRYPCFYRVIGTLVEVWVNSKKLWKHSLVGSDSQSIFGSPKLPLVFYNSVKTRNVFSIS